MRNMCDVMMSYTITQALQSLRLITLIDEVSVLTLRETLHFNDSYKQFILIKNDM